MRVAASRDREPVLFPLQQARNTEIVDGGLSDPRRDLHDILDFLRRQFSLILSVVAVVTALAVAGTLLATPIYSATGLVLVDPNRRSLLDPALRTTNPSADGARVGSDVEIMRSDGVLLKVMSDVDLATDEEFGFRHPLVDKVGSFLSRRPLAPPSDQQVAADVLERFRKAVSVQRRGSTNLIAVTMRSEDPHKAARLANAIAYAHIELERLAKIEATWAERSTIEAQIGQSRRTLVMAETALSGFISRETQRAARPNPPPLPADWSVLHPALPGAGEPDHRRFSAPDTAMAAGLPSDMRAELYALQQSAADASRQFQTLLSRRQTLEAEASLQVPDSRVVSEAIAPARPGFPDLPLVAALAGILACGMGVGVAFLRENYVGGFTTVRQVGAVTRRRVGAVLPREAPPRGSLSLGDMLLSAPFSGFCESVRRLRATVDSTLGSSGPRLAIEPRGAVVMVTSALASEGKTTVALSLARAYALSGRSVILLDCDMRKPALHSHLGVRASTGLVDVLTGKVTNSDLSRILVDDPRSDVTSIVGSRAAERPTDQLFATRSFGQIIQSARESFDYVLIDAPPIEPVVDGMYLARHADAVVFVVRWATTPQRAVLHALDQLTTMGKPSADVIVALNGQEGGSSAYGKGYPGAG